MNHIIKSLILIILTSVVMYGQGIDPSQISGTPYKNGLLRGTYKYWDDIAGDSLYLYQHVDSLGLADSIYMIGDTIFLRDGSGYVQVRGTQMPSKDNKRLVLGDGYGGNLYVPNSLVPNMTTQGKVLRLTDYNVYDWQTYEAVKAINVFDRTIMVTTEVDSLVNVGFYDVATDTALVRQIVHDSLSVFTGGSGGGIDSTAIIGGWGIESVEYPANNFNLEADSTQVATKYDLTTKQNTLISGTNIKTVNGNSLLGAGNVSVGTVTSVGVSSSNGSISISGSPITSSGTVTINGTRLRIGSTWYSGDLDLSYGTTGTTPSWSSPTAGNMRFNLPSGTNGQVLKHNGTDWAAGTDNSTAPQNLSVGTKSGANLPINISGGSGINFTDGVGTSTFQNSTSSFSVDLVGAANSVKARVGTTSGTLSDVSLLNSQLIGRGSTGNVSAITLGSGLSMSGNTLIASGSSVQSLSYGFKSGARIPLDINLGGSGVNIDDGTGIVVDRTASNVITINSNHSYSQMFYTSPLVSVGQTANAYTKVPFTGMETSSLAVYTYNDTNDWITVGATGLYMISYKLSAKCATAGTARAAIYVNGALNDRSITEMDIVDTGKYYSYTGSYVQSIASGQTVQLRTYYSSSSTLDLEFMSVSIVRIY